MPQQKEADWLLEQLEMQLVEEVDGQVRGTSSFFYYQVLMGNNTFFKFNTISNIFAVQYFDINIDINYSVTVVRRKLPRLYI